MRTRDVMTTSVVTVRPGDFARHAAGLLSDNGFTMLPVVDDSGAFVGVVTEADVLRDRLPVDPRSLVHGRPVPERPAAATTVEQVMSQPPVVASPAMDVAALADIMRDQDVRSVPVIDGPRLAGVVTRRDMLRAISRDDDLIGTEIRHRLRMVAGPDRWTVSVTNGCASIVDSMDDPTDRHIAEVLARAVAGVVEVRFPEASRAAEHG
ncbi:CBS domain-containing protein [Lentzea sp. NBRC 105346]|uniref:CBS domain-containing protein n=1 Tax=Lentzea sp. NBRC 105346 TaxID=3032205 RepID=UPI0024A32A9C|nr:CBS domain-containing protein [Lentzea sp. NBRC 105346]GLZ27818.1 CBS domain-containing protein [Lentzea sp. NBRC 105346]